MGLVMVSEQVLRIRVPTRLRSDKHQIVERADVPSGRRHAMRSPGFTLCGLPTTQMRVWDGQDYFKAAGSIRNRCDTCLRLAHDSAFSTSTLL